MVCEAFLRRLKNNYPVDSAVHISYNRLLVYIVIFKHCLTMLPHHPKVGFYERRHTNIRLKTHI